MYRPESKGAVAYQAVADEYRARRATVASMSPDLGDDDGVGIPVMADRSLATPDASTSSPEEAPMTEIRA
jgi:hypothetical protein